MLHQVCHPTYLTFGFIDSPLYQQLSYGVGPQGFDHPDLPALTVAIGVLKKYIGDGIRSLGLAYASIIDHNPESGNVYLHIYRSPDSWKAVNEAEKMIRDLIDKKV